MHTSSYWINHFKENLTKQRIHWQMPEVSSAEKQAILYSLKAWQKGETSDGCHLKAATLKYSRRIKDPDYYHAIELFIKEEQKHGENLGKYIDLLGEKRLRFDLGDYLFRMVRYFATSMEIWTITVIIVESAAQVFYQALKDATECRLLKDICTDILIDEAYHITFQQERLAQIFANKGFVRFHLAIVMYYILYRFTRKAIWLGHAKAFKAGGVTKEKFYNLMELKLQKIFHAVADNHNLFQKKLIHLNINQ